MSILKSSKNHRLFKTYLKSKNCNDFVRIVWKKNKDEKVTSLVRYYFYFRQHFINKDKEKCKKVEATVDQYSKKATSRELFKKNLDEYLKFPKDFNILKQRSIKEFLLFEGKFEINNIQRELKLNAYDAKRLLVLNQKLLEPKTI